MVGIDINVIRASRENKILFLHLFDICVPAWIFLRVKLYIIKVEIEQLC